MPEEPTSQPPPPPQLDETLDARPYEPAKPRPCPQARTALLSGLIGVFSVVLALAVGTVTASDYAMLALLPLFLGLACGSIAVVVGIVAMAKIGRSKGLLTGLGQASAGLTVGVVLVLIPLSFLLTLRPVRENPKRARCKTNLRQLGLALNQYADDHGGVFPEDLSSLFPRYLDNAEHFSCPVAPSRWKPIRKAGRVDRENTSYVYVAGLKASDPGACVLAFDRPGNHEGKGGTVLFVDCSVSWFRAPEPGEFGWLKDMLDETREAVRKRGGVIRVVGEE